MKTPKLTALLIALLAAWGGPAPAAPIDYGLTIPLVDIDSTSMTASSLLSGILSYDDDTMSGTGTFTFADASGSFSDTYAGFAFLLPLMDSTMGVLFDGSTLAGSRLYFNIVADTNANTIVSNRVNLCSVGCAMFNSIGATIRSAAIPQSTFPGDVSAPGDVAVPADVSPVPLPPAVSLFGGALLGLATLGVGRRLRQRPQAVTQICRAGYLIRPLRLKLLAEIDV